MDDDGDREDLTPRSAEVASFISAAATTVTLRPVDARRERQGGGARRRIGVADMKAGTKRACSPAIFARLVGGGRGQGDNDVQIDR